MAETETNQTESHQRTPEDIEAEIARTRVELADTASAVAEKTDVKAQAQKKVDETKAHAQQKVDETKTAVSENPVPVAAIAGALVGAFLLLWLWRR